MAEESIWRRRLRQIPRSVWALGYVSMCMDISSEMIHALLPIYLVGVLGASALTVGLIEGIAEAAAMITKVFSGALSDWLGRRKLLAIVGYGLAALTKPIFPLASGLGWLFAARFIDRIGKGIRGAPRDALVADLSPPHVRGASFGLRQSLDTIGAFAGPLLAIVLMALTDSFSVVFWIAVIPAFIAVGVLVYAVDEPPRAMPGDDNKPRLRFADTARLSRSYWIVVGIGAVFTLARFSEAFLVLKAQDAGLPIALVPAVLVLMNIVYSLSAYPSGVISDRVGRHTMLRLGIAFLIVGDIFLAFSPGIFGLAIGIVFWGLHMGFTQSMLATLVADTAPPDMRGTAFGIFNLACGVAMLFASLIAGALWDGYGPTMTFLAGAWFAAAAGIALILMRWRGAGPPPDPTALPERI